MGGSRNCLVLLTYSTAFVLWVSGSEKVQNYVDVIYGWSFTCLTLRKRWNNHIFNFGNRDVSDLNWPKTVLDQQILSLWNCDCFLVWNRSQFWKFQALQVEIIFSWSMKVNCRCNQVIFWDIGAALSDWEMKKYLCQFLQHLFLNFHMANWDCLRKSLCWCIEHTSPFLMKKFTIAIICGILSVR